jgi:peptidoglycan pentaglycine glycine transferase (the first glycine)
VAPGPRRCVAGRRGSEADLPIFNRLKDLHSARLGYARRSEAYYTELWKAFKVRGHVELFIAEYSGEPVSALLAITHGDTCGHMEWPWSGEHGDLKPNELLQWEVIKWAKSEGYRVSDWQGIDVPVAEAVLSGREVPDDPRYSASQFKLRFGGQVVLDSPSYDYVYNPVLRLAYRCVPVRVMRSPWMAKLLSKFREAGS